MASYSDTIVRNTYVFGKSHDPSIYEMEQNYMTFRGYRSLDELNNGVFNVGDVVIVNDVDDNCTLSNGMTVKTGDVLCYVDNGQFVYVST